MAEGRTFQRVLITDGTLTASVRNTGSSDSLNVSVVDAAGAQITTFPVSGTVTANAGTGPWPVTDNGGTLTVDAPVAAPVAVRLSDGTAFLTTTGGRLSVDASGVAVPVTDNSLSLTVDAPVGTPVAARLSDGTAFLTTTSGRLSVDASGVPVPVTDNGTTLSVDDGGGALTVDGTVGVTVGVGATDLGKAEDAAHTTGDVGIMALAVRQDADASLVGLDLDYSPLQVDATGRLKVVVLGTATVSGTVTANAGTNLNTSALNLEATQAAINTKLDTIDDWDETDRCKVNLISAQVGVDGGSGVVSAKTVRVCLATDVALPTGTNSLGAVTQATASNFNAQVVGNVAHDAADSGNPIKVGGKAVNHGTSPSVVASGDRHDLLTTREGQLWVIPGHPNIKTFRENYTAAQTDNELIAAAANKRIVLTFLQATVDNACTVDVGVTFEKGTATNLFDHPGVPRGGIWTVGTGSGVLAISDANQSITVTTEVATGGSVTIQGSYYEITEA